MQVCSHRFLTTSKVAVKNEYFKDKVFRRE